MELEDEATGFVSSKLKIPNRPGQEKQQDQEEEEEESGGTVAAAGTRKELQSPRVCELCGKVFRSGKALGGHMRMHSQSHLDRSRSNYRSKTATRLTANATSPTTTSVTAAVCCLCGKNFPSMKSLFGHMRSHPDREWRGIQPPPATAKAATTSPTSTLSDADDDQIQIADSASAAVDVDLSKTLSGCSWPVSTKRGRTSGKNTTAVVPEEQAKNEAEAVSDLLMLSRGGGDGGGGGINKEEFDFTGTSSSMKSKPDRDDDYKGKGNYKPRHHFGEDYDHSESHNSQSIVMENMKRKKRRKMKLEDLEEGGVVMVPNNSNRSYTCNICNRSFPSHQALGGHRSSHNNNINRIMTMKINAMNYDRRQSAALIGHQDEHHHQCKICNKMFPTGQALGGHKRSHWNNNPMELLATQSSSPSPGEASQTSNRTPKVPVISFDLNELPPMEEDDNGNDEEQVISTSTLTLQVN